MKNLFTIVSRLLQHILTGMLHWSLRHGWWRLANKLLVFRSKLNKPISPRVFIQPVMVVSTDTGNESASTPGISSPTVNNPQHPIHFLRKVGG